MCVYINHCLQLCEDIDQQVSQSQLHIVWHSFHHVDQAIRYQLAIGSQPGSEDVASYMNVTPPSQILTNLTLEPFKVQLGCNHFEEKCFL